MRIQRILSISIVLCLFPCTAVIAQKQTQQQRQRAVKEAQDQVQRRIDEEAVRNMPDSGADVAFVVALKANLREEPLRTGAVLKEVERGEALTLVEREPTGTFYHVIEVDSAIEGWIDQSVVVIKLTANRYNAPKFEQEENVVYENPKVKITNQELYTDLNLKINGKLYVIKANTTRTLTLDPGRYEYYGWSPGVRATIGKGEFSKGYIYSWSFFIRRR